MASMALGAIILGVGVVMGAVLVFFTMDFYK